MSQMELIKQLKAQISNCMLRDQFPLRRAIDDLGGVSNVKPKSGKGKSRKPLTVEQIVSRIEKSVALCRQRENVSLSIQYPEILPVSERVDELKKVISENQVTVIAGETGSGKTTQIPKICLELGYGRKARIGHTQPRRLAATSVATRLAEELNVELGSQVGYQVRFKDNSNEQTLIKLMTDGVY